MKNLALILVVLIIFQIASVEAISCYVCDAKTDNCFTGATSGCSACLIVKATGYVNGTSGANVSKICSDHFGSGCMY